MAVNSRFFFRTALLGIFSFLVAVAVYRTSDAVLRRKALAEMSDRAMRLQELRGSLHPDKKADRAEQSAVLEEMRRLLAETQEYAAAVSAPSVVSVLLGLATCVVLISGGVLALTHAAGLRTQAAALMDPEGARAHGLTDPSAFRFEEKRLVLTRPLTIDSVEDLHDFRIAIAQIIDGSGDVLEIDASPITEPTSQVFGILAEAALEAREHGKQLRVRVSAAFAELASMVGLDKLLQLTSDAEE